MGSKNFRYLKILSAIASVILLTGFKSQKEIKDQIVISKVTYQENETSCSANVKQCLPLQIQKSYELKPQMMGPNCWNSVLVATKILPHMRYTKDKEFNFYMKSPICRILKNSEVRQAGDIGSIILKSKIPRGMDGIEHSFVYINNKLIYAKKNPSIHSSYDIYPIELLKNDYNINVNSNCFSNEYNPACEVGAQFHRCMSFEDYLNKQQNVSENIRNVLKLSDQIDNAIEKIVLYKRLPPNELKSEIIKIKNLLGIGVNSDSDKFILQSIYLRLDSMIDQLRAISDVYSAPELEENIVMLKDYIYQLQH